MAEEPKWRRLGPDRRREELLACAVRLFSSRPYSEVSAADIAAEAGVARGLINHYFGTKRQLYLEVVRQASAVPPLDPDRLSDGTLEQRAAVAVEWFLDSLEERGGSWLRATGISGLGDDAAIDAILFAAEGQAVDRVLEAVGLADHGHVSELRALIRAYGQLATAGGREWLIHRKLSREQVRTLLHTTLLTVVRENAASLLDR